MALLYLVHVDGSFFIMVVRYPDVVHLLRLKRFLGSGSAMIVGTADHRSLLFLHDINNIYYIFKDEQNLKQTGI